MSNVSRRDRLVDLAALVCILAGAAMCFISNTKLGEISKFTYRHPGPPNESALAAADRARYLAYGGVAIIAAGCTVGAAGAIRVARRKAV
jgi:hypothetical protein